MSKNKLPETRRNFLKMGIISSVAIPLNALLIEEQALAASHLPKLDLSNPTAQALNYTHDATQSQRTSDDQACRTCHQYAGDRSAEWGECNIFQENLVNSGGWCSAYLKKVG